MNEFVSFCGRHCNQRLDEKLRLASAVVAVVYFGWNMDAVVMAKVSMLVESISYRSKHANGK